MNAALLCSALLFLPFLSLSLSLTHTLTHSLSHLLSLSFLSFFTFFSHPITHSSYFSALLSLSFLSLTLSPSLSCLIDTDGPLFSALLSISSGNCDLVHGYGEYLNDRYLAPPLTYLPRTLSLTHSFRRGCFAVSPGLDAYSYRILNRRY